MTAQTAERQTGGWAIADRVISLCDVDARPIQRGKPQKQGSFADLSLAAKGVEYMIKSLSQSTTSR